MTLLGALMLIGACQAVQAQANAQSVTSTRVSQFDWQCQDAQGNRISDHQRFDTAFVACLNSPDGVYVQGGRYRINKPVVQPIPEPEPEPISEPEPDPQPIGELPLSWDAVTGTTNSGRLTLSSGQSRSGLSITDSSGLPAITCNGSCTLERIRIRAREGLRCVSGNITIDGLWVEATGVGDDHADGLQCYAPGSNGSVTVRNTTFRTGGSSTAGYFSADNWRGSHSFENVVFWGGNHGLRIPADGGSSVRLKDVYFVRDSFRYGAFLFDVVNGKRIDIQQWENVRWATIESGRLVPGAEIPRP